MKINNYGKTSLLASLLSWVILFIFNWLLCALYFGSRFIDVYRIAKESILLFLVLPPGGGLLGFPCAILSIILGIISLFKEYEEENRLMATISFFSSIPLFLLSLFSLFLFFNT